MQINWMIRFLPRITILSLLKLELSKHSINTFQDSDSEIEKLSLRNAAYTRIKVIKVVQPKL